MFAGLPTTRTCTSEAALATAIQTAINADSTLSAASKSVVVTHSNGSYSITSGSIGSSSSMVVNAIGHLAELAWHHPDLVVSYAFVEVKLMNHAKKGITQLDVDLAKKIDEFLLWNPKDENSALDGTPEDPRFAYVKRK